MGQYNWEVETWARRERKVEGKATVEILERRRIKDIINRRWKIGKS